MTIPVGGYDYEADAIADGLIHYYPMFELSGTYSTITDYIGGNNLYTYNSNPDNAFSDIGILGTSFDTTANGIETAHNWLQSKTDLTDNTTLNDFSIAFYVKPKTIITGGEDRYVFNMAVSNGVKFYISDTLGRFVLETFSGGTLDTGVAPLADTLYHVVIINDYTLNDCEVYINGASVGSTNSDTFVLYQYNWYIGNSAGSISDATYLSCYIDEFMIFDRKLTSTDVANLYNTGTPFDVIKYLQSGRVLLSEAISLSSAVAWNFDLSVTDQIGIDDSQITAALILLADAADQTGVTETQIDDPMLIAMPIVEDNLATLGVFDEDVLMSAVAADGVNFITAFNVSGESYVGVVMNTQNQAVTEYGNFDFNSMAYLGSNQYFGAKSDGIYELDGSDDAGSQIDAFLSTHLMDFGEQEFKRVERAYLGFRNDGPMVLKTIVRDDATGERKEYWYDLTQTSEAARIERIKVGKGLKSHLWQFELHSNEGADFELDSLEFVPIVLSRRV